MTRAKSLLRHSSAFGLLAMLSLGSPAALAQQPPRPYDGIQAGLDAYRLGEERRRSDFQQQIEVNEDLRFWSGQPSLNGETMWYRDALRPSYGGFGGAYGFGPAPLVEPWGYGPGAIWSSNYTTPFRQPAGRWEGQTGPNRWESHPVYDPPITPYRASTPVDSPWLERTPYAMPQPRVYEWSDGFSGAPDTEYSPVMPRPPAAELRSDVVPEDLSPPPSAAGDEFDTPRGTRDKVAPPPSPRPRRTRDF